LYHLHLWPVNEIWKVGKIARNLPKWSAKNKNTQTPLGTNKRQDVDKLALSESNPFKPECPYVWRKTINLVKLWPIDFLPNLGMVSACLYQPIASRCGQ
jgi:hypothetical protein